MKVLEQFMIALGLKVDEKSFQTGEAAFGGLTKSALQLGAVLASKLAIDKVVGDFKNAGTELNNFNKLTGISTQNVQGLGQAYASMGGSASDAFDDLKKMQDLIASPSTGNTGWFGDAAKFGLDPSAIIGAQSTADALANIAKEFEHMTPLNQRLAANAIGLSEAGTRLAMQGEAAVRTQFDITGKIGIMTGKQVEDAARLTKANSELNLVFTDMGNTIAGELTPAFADMAEDFVAFYRDNKDLIDSGLKEFFGELADNIELVAIAMALLGGSAALKGLASLRAIVGLGGAAKAATAGAGAVAAGGASMLTVAGGSIAALLYSSSLNEGEGTELLNNKLKKGGTEAAGASIDFFRSKGWTEEQAMGITANIEQESGFKHDIEGDGGQAYGLAQWHPDRQAEFAKFSGKDIRQATGLEQLEFINHELTRGKEKAAGEKLREATTPYEAAGVVSKYYERPADREGEAGRRGDMAETYGRSDRKDNQASGAPVVDLSDPIVWARIQKELKQSGAPQEGVLDQAKAWLESYRKTPAKPDQIFGAELDSARKPDPKAAYEDPAAPRQGPREAPREHSVNRVVQPPSQESVPPPTSQAGPVAQPSYTDNRQFHIHGADVEKVKQLYTEQLSNLTEQTMQDFRSPEK